MRWLLGFLGLAAAFLGLSAWFVIRPLLGTPAAETAPATAVPAAAEATPEQVHSLCGACHAYPPPEAFPRSAWRKEVKQGYDFLRHSTLAGPYPSQESVVRYYETRAPLELPLPRVENAPGEVPLRFNRQGFRSADGGHLPRGYQREPRSPLRSEAVGRAELRHALGPGQRVAALQGQSDLARAWPSCRSRLMPKWWTSTATATLT